MCPDIHSFLDSPSPKKSGDEKKFIKNDRVQARFEVGNGKEELFFGTVTSSRAGKVTANWDAKGVYKAEKKTLPIQDVELLGP